MIGRVCVGNEDIPSEPMPKSVPASARVPRHGGPGAAQAHGKGRNVPPSPWVLGVLSIISSCYTRLAYVKSEHSGWNNDDVK